jgi:hypothetical protein
VRASYLEIASASELRQKSRDAAQVQDADACILAALLEAAESFCCARNDLVVDRHGYEVDENVDASQGHELALQHGCRTSLQDVLRKLLAARKTPAHRVRFSSTRSTGA